MKLRSGVRLAMLLAGFATMSACGIHSTAKNWHGHVGADGVPVYVQQSTYIGCNVAVLLPVLGSTNIRDMVADAAGNIDRLDGTHLRVVETETSNYWWSVPPLTWFVTPVMASIVIEYRPSSQALARDGIEAPVDPVAAPPR